MRAHLGEDRKAILDTDGLVLWYALNRLIANYWADVDDEGGSHAHEFYVPKALYTVGNNRFEGADRIRAFYARRRQHGTITTRHLVGKSGSGKHRELAYRRRSIKQRRCTSSCPCQASPVSIAATATPSRTRRLG